MFETLNIPSFYGDMSHPVTNVLPPSQALERSILDFYISISTKVFQSHKHLSQYVSVESMDTPVKKTSALPPVQINETYMVTKNFALCAFRRGFKELYCVFDVLVPQYALVDLTKETFELIQAKLTETK